jgi:DNA-binding XRE family transcriptional regulator
MRKFTTFDEFMEEELKNPEFKAAYDALEPEFALASSMIKARLAKKMTQAELAKEAGVQQTTIARLESGASNPTFSTIHRVAAVLGKELRLVGSRS